MSCCEVLELLLFLPENQKLYLSSDFLELSTDNLYEFKI